MHALVLKRTEHQSSWGIAFSLSLNTISEIEFRIEHRKRNQHRESRFETSCQPVSAQVWNSDILNSGPVNSFRSSLAMRILASICTSIYTKWICRFTRTHKLIQPGAFKKMPLSVRRCRMSKTLEEQSLWSPSSSLWVLWEVLWGALCEDLAKQLNRLLNLSLSSSPSGSPSGSDSVNTLNFRV